MYWSNGCCFNRQSKIMRERCNAYLPTSGILLPLNAGELKWRNYYNNETKMIIMKKTNWLLALIAVVLMCSCRQIAQSSIESSVEDLNERCPIKLGKVDVLTKVEYRNNAICFYVTENEERDTDFSSLTSEQIEKAENSLDFKREMVGMCLANKVVLEELDNITETMADEVGLTFRVFIKGGTSKRVLKAKLSWKEIQDLRSEASEW